MTKIFPLFIFLSGFISLLFSLLLLYKKKNFAASGVFFSLSVAVTVFALSVLDFDEGKLLTLRKLSLSALCLLAISYNYYGLSFQNSTGGIKFRLPLGFLGLLFLFSLASLPGGLLIDSVFVEDDEAIYFIGSLGKPFILLLSVGLALAIANLEWIYRSARGTSKWRVKYLSWGLIWGLAFSLFSLGYPLIYGFDRTSVLLATGVALALSFYPSAYVILRRRALESGLYVSRQVAYGSLVVVFLGLYFIILGIVIRVFYQHEKFGFPQLALLTFIFSIIGGYIFLSEGLRRRAMNLIAANFYSHKYDYRRVWNEFSRDISNYFTVESLIPPMSEAVGEIIGAKWVAYFESQQNSWRQVYGSPVSLPPDLAGIKASPKETVVKTKPDQDGAEGRIALKLIGVNDEVFAYLLLGAKISGDDYDPEDIEMLKTLGEQASRRLYEVKLSQEMASYREIESAGKISTFLLHDLKNVSAMLSMVIKNAPKHIHDPAFQDDLLLTLRDTEDKIKGLMTNISLFPGEINLNLGFHSLNDVLSRVAARFRNQRVDVEFSPLADEDAQFYFDDNLLEKLFMNIILNAMQAIEEAQKGGRIAAEIDLHSGEGENVALVRIRDDGPGLPESALRGALFKPFHTTKKGGAGVGLYQCKLIAEAHGGGIEVRSERGEGAEFLIRIPMNRDAAWKRNYSS